MTKRVLFFVLFISKPFLAYEYPRPIDKYYSQKGQDKFLNENIFKNKKNGVFVEVGAHDGISFSNSYFFEKNLEWTGICIEPNPKIFNTLKANRSCICEQLCISNSDEIKEFLLCDGYILEMYSGLLENYDPRHLNRIDEEISVFGGNKKIISVNCCILQDLLDKHNIKHIDFLSIDTEGGETFIIKSIDFEKISIDIIIVENNFNESDIKNYLETKNYILIEHIGKDDIYIKRI